MGVRKHIPNFITLLNLFCGALAVIYGLKGWQLFAVYLIVLASLFDFLDGFASRLLNAYSNVGKELDSLSDLVSFGLAPSILLYQRFDTYLSPVITQSFSTVPIEILSFTPLLITLFSALRLAKFNVDDTQVKSFRGLPTPANALFIAMIVHFSVYNSGIDFIFDNLFFIPLLSVVLSLLLTSNIKMFSLKFNNLRFAENRRFFIFAAIALIAVIPVIATSSTWSLIFVVIFALYILYNTVLHITGAKV